METETGTCSPDIICFFHDGSYLYLDEDEFFNKIDTEGYCDVGTVIGNGYYSYNENIFGPPGSPAPDWIQVAESRVRPIGTVRFRGVGSSILYRIETIDYDSKIKKVVDDYNDECTRESGNNEPPSLLIKDEGETTEEWIWQWTYWEQQKVTRYELKTYTCPPGYTKYHGNCILESCPNICLCGDYKSIGVPEQFFRSTDLHVWTKTGNIKQFYENGVEADGEPHNSLLITKVNTGTLSGDVGIACEDVLAPPVVLIDGTICDVQEPTEWFPVVNARGKGIIKATVGSKTVEINPHSSGYYGMAQGKILGTSAELSGKKLIWDFTKFEGIVNMADIQCANPGSNYEECFDFLYNAFNIFVSEEIISVPIRIDRNTNWNGFAHFDEMLPINFRYRFLDASGSEILDGISIDNNTMDQMYKSMYGTMRIVPGLFNGFFLEIYYGEYEDIKINCNEIYFDLRTIPGVPYVPTIPDDKEIPSCDGSFFYEPYGHAVKPANNMR